jgi:hypothetical protein
MRNARLSTGTTGLLVMCIAAWGGVVAYAGPTFQFETRGSTAAWVWNEAHTTLNLAPAIGGLIGGLLMIVAAGWALERIGAMLAMASGAWFLVGPSLEPLWLKASTGTTMIGTSTSATIRALEGIGYYYGVGGALVLLGAFAVGVLAVVPAPVTEPSEAGSETVVRRRMRFHRPSHA